MPQLFLYWESHSEVDRDEVEEVVTSVLDVQGEVVGAGSGLGITNVDLDLASVQSDRHLLEELDAAVAWLQLSGAFWQWERSEEKHAVGAGLPDPPK